MGSRPHGPRRQGEERREKSEERREKREERREKRDEIRKKREESPKEAARGPQMRPQEVPKEVPRGLWASWRPDSVRGKDGEAKGRPPPNALELPRVCFPKVLKIRGCHEDGRSSNHCTFTVSRDHIDGGEKRAQKKACNLRSLFEKPVF